MSLRPPTEHENTDLRHAGMDGRHPGLQGRVRGNIHVNLDSSTPCWNDAIEGFCFKLIEVPPPGIFKEGHEGVRILLTINFVLFASFVVKFAFPFLVAARGVRSLAVDVPPQETRKSLH